ncbi:MAG: ABC transporter substrate-binding protein [Anaerolineales bacterium]|nr:ABC transporter substrate-binding protein [Anaerolineales bacterium]
MRKTALKIITMVCLFTLIGGGLVGCGGKDVIKIGAPMPLTGPYASDGEQFQMALQMAIDEQNAKGGVLGKQLDLIPGDVGALEAEKIKAVGERLSGEGVDLVITGYADSGVDARVFGEYDMPYLHADAMSADTDVVASDLEKYGNVFQYCPSEVSYGYDAAENLFNVPEKMGWTEPNKKVAAIRADYSYNVLASDKFLELAQEQGYEVAIDEIVQFGTVEWGPILSKIQETQPAYVTFWILDPTDASRFIIQFTEKFGADGYNGLVYMQYTPNFPEFLTLAGEAGNGVIWSTSVGVVSADAPEYSARWTEKFKVEPKSTYAHSVRDGFEIWLQAVEKAGCVDCYDKVNENIRTMTYTGYAGFYQFDPKDQQAKFGDDFIPTLWYQVQDGKHVIMRPDAYKQGDYQLPPWIK